MKTNTVYIHQLSDWTEFTFDHKKILPLLGKVRGKQGELLGRMKSVGFDLQMQRSYQNLTLDILKSSEIEGEFLKPDSVRSSIARRLGLKISGLTPTNRYTDGIVEMMMDATQNFQDKLTKEKLFGWHAALFPTGRSGLYKIEPGKWRTDKNGPMQVVSGEMGNEKVHFQAPDAKRISSEMNHFIKWFNKKSDEDQLIKAAIAHFWFVTIHPFDDGNGRITRALTDMLLAKAEGMSQRFYSMSAQIMKERKSYYLILERVSKDSTDITGWIEWFLNCLLSALEQSHETSESVFAKAKFWDNQKTTHFNPRQIKMLNKLFDHFDGKLTSIKWAKMNKCSADTALRDIQDLLDKKILKKESAGGRSTSYLLK